LARGPCAWKPLVAARLATRETVSAVHPELQRDFERVFAALARGGEAAAVARPRDVGAGPGNRRAETCPGVSEIAIRDADWAIAAAYGQQWRHGRAWCMMISLERRGPSGFDRTCSMQPSRRDCGTPHP
jgi:hypothetical protein